MFIYKRNTAIMWTVLVLALVFFAIIMFANGINANWFFYFLLFLFCEIIWVIVIRAIDISLFSKMFRQFYNDCDVLALRKKFEKVYDSSLPALQEWMLVHYSSIYRNCGETDKALDCLSRINLDKLEKRKSPLTTYSDYFTQLALVHIELKDFDAAHEAIDGINNLIRCNFIRKFQLEAVNLNVVDLMHILKLSTNISDEELGYFKFKLDTSKENLMKVKYSYYYGQALYSNGNFDKADKSFQYVIDNGSSLYLVDLAKENICKCREQSQLQNKNI